MYKHGGKLNIPAPLWVFAPCALSNTLSSFGQYQALHYVSFPLQTIAKSTKVIPVMIMGKVLNKKTYPCVDYIGSRTHMPRRIFILPGECHDGLLRRRHVWRRLDVRGYGRRGHARPLHRL